MEDIKKCDEKKFADMTYIEFIKDVLKIELTTEQEVLVKLFEENKTRKVECINTNPIFNYKPFDNGCRPVITTDEHHSSCLDNIRTIK